MDLFVGFMLLSKKFRWTAVFITVSFHFLNFQLFNIGIFPWVMMSSTFLFFPPEQTHSVVTSFINLFTKSNKKNATSKLKNKPNSKIKQKSEIKNQTSDNEYKFTIYQKLLIVFFVLFAIYQILMPLRPFLYPGNALWTEHGHRYSWRMKLNNKDCDLTFIVYQNQTEEWFELPNHWFVSLRQYQKSLQKPEFLLQYVHFVSNSFKKNGVPAEVYCIVSFLIMIIIFYL